ncbi:MAG: hypothetical protein P9L94_01670 [Candidatus Hinthialibacter antarcticus]|nr:hypothetical protein [Candidatus Hinthialibacter antarcticus]
MLSSNAAGQQIAPPVGASAASAASASVTFFVNTQQYEFSNPALDPTPDFKIKVSEPRVMMGLISVQSFITTMRTIPVYQGGFWVQNATGQMFSPLQIAGLGECKMVRHAIEGNRLVLEYEETVFGAVLRKRYEFRLLGRSLEIALTDVGGPQQQARYIGFSFGPTRYVGRPKFVSFPTSPLPALQSLGRFYLSLYVDPFRSNVNRFTYSARRENSRSFYASNTPAWIETNEGETAEPLKVVGYVTVSENPLDVAPMRPATLTPDSRDLRRRIALDWSETPFIPLDRGYVTQIRRWSAPTSGPVELNGTVKLSGGDQALFEVILERPGDAPRLLFSQMLDAKTKPATGLKGTFPLAQNDQLLFACQSPAVMQGGVVDLRVQMQQGSARYDSMDDFSSTQGHNGWYYEQKHKQGASLLLWNPTVQAWESPDSRSTQGAFSMTVRSGPKGDAFPTAAQFLSRLNDVGILNPMFVLRDWDAHAVDAIQDHEMSEEKWGSNSVLQSIDAALTASQVRVEYQWPPHPLKNFNTLSQLTIVDANEGSDLAAFLVSDDEEEAEAEPEAETPSAKPTASVPLLGAPASSATAEAVPAADERFTRGLYRFVENREHAPLLPSVAPLLVDDALRNQRPARPIVGFGGYAKFLGEDDGAAWQDERFFPFDEYLTATAAFGRVPHISDRLWSAGGGPSDVLRRMIEAASLMQPVMNEILDPLNAVLSIQYFNDKDEALDVQQLLYLQNFSKAGEYNRIHIQYVNGMNVYANRSDAPWTVNAPGLGVDAIAPGGFLARNERTSVASLIALRGERTFSVCVSPNAYFINSRDGALLRVGEFAGDGLCKLSLSPFNSHWDVALSGAHEISNSETLLPILRANHRVDAAMKWTSASTLTLNLHEAEDEVCMIELFDLPQDKIESAHAKIQRLSGEEIGVPLDVVSSGGQRGLRIVEVAPGDRLVISFE